MTQVTVTSRTIAVEHIKISSKHSFEEVRQKLEGKLPKFDRNIAAALSNGDMKSVKDYEENGPTLSIVATHDHGANLQIVGRKRNALLYEIGNPLTATKMTRHQLPAASTHRCGWFSSRTSKAAAYLNMTSHRPSLPSMAMSV